MGVCNSKSNKNKQNFQLKKNSNVELSEKIKSDEFLLEIFGKSFDQTF